LLLLHNNEVCRNKKWRVSCKNIRGPSQ
jgi:hypothetical protein